MLVSAQPLIADCALWLGIDRLSGCFRRETFIADPAHWFGVDRLHACVPGDTLIADHTHWFDRLYACVRVDIDS